MDWIWDLAGGTFRKRPTIAPYRFRLYWRSLYGRIKTDLVSANFVASAMMFIVGATLLAIIAGDRNQTFHVGWAIGFMLFAVLQAGVRIFPSSRCSGCRLAIGGFVAAPRSWHGSFVRSRDSSVPIDFNGLDSSVHGPVRLGVLTALQMDGAHDFTTLKKRLEVADGVLGMHVQKLEDVGYIRSRKAFVGRRPKTTYRITAAGKAALLDYLDSMRQLLDAVGAD